MLSVVLMYKTKTQMGKKMDLEWSPLPWNIKLNPINFFHKSLKEDYWGFFLCIFPPYLLTGLLYSGIIYYSSKYGACIILHLQDTLWNSIWYLNTPWVYLFLPFHDLPENVTAKWLVHVYRPWVLEQRLETWEQPCHWSVPTAFFPQAFMIWNGEV